MITRFSSAEAKPKALFSRIVLVREVVRQAAKSYSGSPLIASVAVAITFLFGASGLTAKVTRLGEDAAVSTLQTVPDVKAYEAEYGTENPGRRILWGAVKSAALKLGWVVVTTTDEVTQKTYETIKPDYSITNRLIDTWLRANDKATLSVLQADRSVIRNRKDGVFGVDAVKHLREGVERLQRSGAQPQQPISEPVLETSNKSTLPFDAPDPNDPFNRGIRRPQTTPTPRQPFDGPTLRRP